MASSSSTSSNQKSFKYHVFLSFRGEDTRKTFVDHLYAALKQKGIHTFRDNEELEKGKRIDELFKAIEESRFLIIIFSKNYASSSWCLKELTKIMECQDEKEQIAYPLFYDVEPTDIRKRSGPVGEAIARHKSNEQIQKWEEALESAGNLVGWDLKNIANGHEAEAIKIIVEKISLKLRSIHLNNDENLIGMERRMQDLESSLGIGLNDKARMIGIRGMGGIGKTTLARAIFDKYSSHFEGSCFVADVREVSKSKNLQSLQKQVLSDVLNDKHISVENVYDGKTIMRTRLPYKKVLIVLDDVDDAKQLEVLAGDWFKDGSRIIITTRDRKVLLEHGVNVKWIHDASLMSEEEAMSLFNRYAFKSYIPDEGYEELSSEVVRYAAGLPLTIKVLGSHLHGEEEVFWRDALKRLETIPSQKTLEVLEISYNGLEPDLKELFLDVACFMRNLSKDKAIRQLESCGFRATYGLRILEQKSLITILEDRLLMHDRIEELAKNIVRRSHPNEPNKHSLLWHTEETEELFSDNTGTEGSPCIGLNLYIRPRKLSPENIMKGLGNMNKIRYLKLFGGHEDPFPCDWKFDQAKQYFPNSLQFLSWYRYPFRSLPQTFRANNLVGLELPFSKIVQLWESGERKVLKKLRFLDLSDSNLRTIDLGLTPNLEMINLAGCRDLTELESLSGSICGLQHLRQLALTCGNIEVPKDIDRLKCLEELSLSDIKYLPDSVCMLKHLKSLKLEYCWGIKELQENLGWLEHLEELTLTYLGIRHLPDSICMLKRLRFLKVTGCLYLVEVPKDLGQLECLEKLHLTECVSLGEIPNSICKMKCLRDLDLSFCYKFKKLPEELGSLKLLKELNIKDTRISHLPQSISSLEGLRIVGYDAVRQSCFPESEIVTTELSSQSAENDRKRSFTEFEVMQRVSDGLNKQLCLKSFPQLATITHDPSNGDVAYAALYLALTKFPQSNCIADPISASSTDNYPYESILNTLDPRDKISHRDSYWSSKGSDDQEKPETLIYKSTTNFCVISEFYLHPYQAMFQLDFPIYSSRYVRFRMGHPKFWNEIDHDFVESQECADDRFVWTYTSEMFPMAQENRLQKFKLPEPVVCIGGFLQIELLGRVQKQAMDDKYYICVTHVQAIGRQLSPAFCVEISEKSNDVSLTYDAHEFEVMRQRVSSGD